MLFARNVESPEQVAELAGDLKERAGRPLKLVWTRDEEFTYGRLRAASRAIARGAFFAATNPDPTFPVEDGFWPGGGSIVAAVRAASGGAEPVYAGKPERPMLEEAERALGDADGMTLLISVFTASGFFDSFATISVTSASVPSLPTSNPHKSYPSGSLNFPPIRFTSPFGSTSSSPVTWLLVTP